MWSVVQMDQLVVAACVRLHLQNTEDKWRGMTQIYTARSDEQSQRNSCAHMLKTHEFSSQIPLPQKGGKKSNNDGIFIQFQVHDEGFFGKYVPLSF